MRAELALPRSGTKPKAPGVLERAVGIDGYAFDLQHPATADDLDAVMRGHDMKQFAPELVDGAEVLESDRLVD